ncbi:Vegetative incompatibility protein HET-E-1, partial [Lachnellula subtilissima]
RLRYASLERGLSADRRIFRLKCSIIHHTITLLGDNEVSFEDISDPGAAWLRKLGARKIKYACEQSMRDQWAYVWIDTCCIDKRSSAELSEAINSMYNWYQESEVCCVYLEDALASHISAITKIPEKILEEPLELEYASVAKKMSWAAGRQTTHVEDIAYCLLGLFDVNMPLLYGEGTKAFIRLQEEILMKNSDDQSLFAWNTEQDAPWDESWLLDNGVLAGSPTAFADSGNIIPFPVKAKQQPYYMTNKGLRIELRLKMDDGSSQIYLALLHCQYENDFPGCVGIILKVTSEPSVFSRHSGYGSGMKKVNIKDMEKWKMSTAIYIRKNPRLAESLRRYEACLVRLSGEIEEYDYKIVETRPQNTVWNAESRTLIIWISHYQSSWGQYISVVH